MRHSANDLPAQGDTKDRVGVLLLRNKSFQEGIKPASFCLKAKTMKYVTQFFVFLVNMQTRVWFHLAFSDNQHRETDEQKIRCHATRQLLIDSGANHIHRASVSCPTHFDMQTGGSGHRTTDLLISGRPPESQQHPSFC